jgi:hypothetical protein
VLCHLTEHPSVWVSDEKKDLCAIVLKSEGPIWGEADLEYTGDNVTGKHETSTLERPRVSQTEPERRRRASSRRALLVVQILGAVLVLSSVVVGLTSSHAGASTLSNGTVTIRTGSSGSTASSGSVATNPLQDQSLINVVVGPNSTLNRSSLEKAGFPSGATVIKILECADPGGSEANLPTKPTECDPNTTYPTANLQENGSVFLSKFRVYALPNESVLGPSNGTVCDGSHQCVLGVFSNQNDFTKPFVFSAPFEVAPSQGTETDAGTPASPTPGSATAGGGSTGASAAVSVSPSTLADTGGSEWWPWLLGVGLVLVVVGTVMRYIRRPATRGNT